jgi:hypothetical protein
VGFAIVVQFSLVNNQELTIVIVELEIFEQGGKVQAIFLAFTVHIHIYIGPKPMLHL